MKSIKRVLLVDDDPMTNLINEKIIHFTKGSSKVGSYLNQGKALDYLKKLVKNDSSQFPNVLFLDINMPEKNAWQFFDELKKFPKALLKKCKIFILTSSIDQEDIDKSKTYEMVNEFISKPLTVGKLKSILFSS